jgi:hypothetical protein
MGRRQRRRVDRTEAQESSWCSCATTTSRSSTRGSGRSSSLASRSPRCPLPGLSGRGAEDQNPGQREIGGCPDGPAHRRVDFDARPRRQRERAGPGRHDRRQGTPDLAQRAHPTREPGQPLHRERASGPLRPSLRRFASFFLHGYTRLDVHPSPETTLRLSIIPAFSCSSMWQWNM